MCSTESDQLPDFQLYSQAFDGAIEELIYDSTGVAYGEGIYTIPVIPPKTLRHIIVKRNGIISLCEVEVFEGNLSIFVYIFYI